MAEDFPKANLMRFVFDLDGVRKVEINFTGPFIGAEEIADAFVWLELVKHSMERNQYHEKQSEDGK